MIDFQLTIARFRSKMKRPRYHSVQTAYKLNLATVFNGRRRQRRHAMRRLIHSIELGRALHACPAPAQIVRELFT